MPYCPSCRMEYRLGIDRCPDCGEQLVDELDDPGEETSEAIDWVPIARLNSFDLAQMVVEAMENEGIPVLSLSGTGHFGLTGQMGMSTYLPAGGGFSIVVPSDRVAEADAVGMAIVGDEWAAARLLDIAVEEDGDRHE